MKDTHEKNLKCDDMSTNDSKMLRSEVISKFLPIVQDLPWVPTKG